VAVTAPARGRHAASRRPHESNKVDIYIKYFGNTHVFDYIININICVFYQFYYYFAENLIKPSKVQDLAMMTETHVTDLISTIIETARQQNISQGELATRAGIRQETLSRAKRNPTISLKTFQALARAAGLRIQLVADNPVAEKVADGTLFPS